MNEWISVTDRLPANENPVQLFLEDGEQCVARIKRQGVRRVVGGDIKYFHYWLPSGVISYDGADVDPPPTHWKPLTNEPQTPDN